MKKIVVVAIGLTLLSLGTQAHKRVISQEKKSDSSSTNVPKLRIGDNAPQIKARWVKGKPVHKFEKGMVYVLEFWATWCGPCKKAIPHVTELANKYAGKATIIGVDVWERGRPEQNIAAVDNFVKQMGDKMNYNVCMDGPDKFMADNWLTAAGQSGIPATIIVNKEGKIAWIGYPMAMDGPLAAIIDGTFDLKAFGLKIKTDQEKDFQAIQQREQISAAIKPMQDAVKNKKYKQAITEYENIIAKNPSYKNFLTTDYYKAQVNLDPEKLYQDAVLLKDSVRKVASIVQVFAEEEGLNKKFYKYAIDFYEGQPENMFNWRFMSAAYFNFGNISKAVEFQQKWVDKMKTFSAPPPYEYMEQETARLKKYQDALK